jgi:dimethylargininase
MQRPPGEPVRSGSSDRCIAIVREPAASVTRCEVTFVERRPIDVERARRQHQAYVAALRALGLEVVELPAREEWPDSTFVEDAAIVLDEVAVLTRPGAASRRDEPGGVSETLACYRPLHAIREPGTLDGGDVLRAGRTLYVGRSTRTNDEGIAQVREIATPLGYAVIPVHIRDCLHLKSACAALAPGVFLADPDQLDAAALRAERIVMLPPGERDAADTLILRGHALMPAGYPATRGLLEREGLRVVELDLSEFSKAEAGPTCLSLIIEPPFTTGCPPMLRSRT